MPITKENEQKVADNTLINKIDKWLISLEKGKSLIPLFKKKFKYLPYIQPYISSSQLDKAEKMIFNLRYFGQKVADIIVDRKNNSVILNVDAYKESNLKCFNLDMSGSHEWADNGEAAKFRKFFKDKSKCIQCTGHSLEHFIESRVIQQMKGTKNCPKTGGLRGIRPVTISGIPLQIPVPVSGKSNEPGQGFIDILARRGHGRGVKLSVWELKKPGNREDALKQSYVYAKTLIKMLRSPNGPKWYKFFGFKSSVPQSLEIEAVACISLDQQKYFTKTSKQSIDLLTTCIGNDRINLYVAYYYDFDKEYIKVKNLERIG